MGDPRRARRGREKKGESQQVKHGFLASWILALPWRIILKLPVLATDGWEW